MFFVLFYRSFFFLRIRSIRSCFTSSLLHPFLIILSQNTVRIASTPWYTTIPLPSRLGNHISLASSSRGVVHVLVRFISLMMILGFFSANFDSNSFVCSIFSSIDHDAGANHENFSNSPSAHLVDRFMMASMGSCISNIYDSSAANAISGFIVLRFPAIFAAFDTVLLMMISFFIPLWTSSNAIPLAVPPAPSMIMVLPARSSPISLNLSLRLSQYHAASELYPWISSPKCATKFVDCIASATGSTKYFSFFVSFPCNRSHHESLNQTPSHHQIYLSFALSTSSIFARFSALLTTMLVLISNPYFCAIKFRILGVMPA